MKYDTEHAKIVISVPELCSMAMPHGDIDNRTNRAKKRSPGEKIRKKIQKEANCPYSPLLPITHTSLHNGICYEVSGEADGIMKQDGNIIVEEISSVRHENDIEASPVSFAKVKCLAHFICDETEIPSIKVRLTFYIEDTKEIRHIDKEYTRAELSLFYSNMIERISRFAVFEKERVLERYPGISDAHFPFPHIRDGQREFISEAFRAIKHKRRLFAQAPTGTGKTMSALYPAAKALGEGMCDKIFYLTAKTSTGVSAVEAAKKLAEAGAVIKTVTVSAKESVCFCRNAGAHPACDPDECEYARGYYERVWEAIYELLTSQDSYTKKTLLAYARKYRICPYEFSLDLSRWCDLIVCDYNYLFDPRVYFRRYFDFPSERYVFLIDEAHNLADRAREMYSATISLAPFIKLYSMLSEKDKVLFDVTERTAKEIYRQKKLIGDEIKSDENGDDAGFYISREPLAELNLQLKKFTDSCERWFYVYRDLDERYAPLKNQVTELYFAVREYLGILDCYDKRFITYVELKGDNVSCKLFCLDPSHVLDICMNRGISSVLFSATLTPTDYFKDILGGGKNAQTLTLPSPFERDKLCLAAVDTVSTRYADRDENAGVTADIIAAAVCGKKGNYIAYFPSYKYMNTVYSVFKNRYPSVKTAIQKGGAKRTDTSEFLSRFVVQNDDFFVGFCVLGGSFSEGIDLPGERLIGAVVVGVGLPQISSELNIIRDKYEEEYEAGYDYAYVYPGMNKILQATGRVIRREEDVGIVVLVDDRYATPEYTRLFPEHWSDLKYAGNARSLAALVKRFWQKNTQNEQKQ